ncbi:unnamed protein product, partial [Effrenium voratum]
QVWPYMQYQAPPPCPPLSTTPATASFMPEPGLCFDHVPTFHTHQAVEQKLLEQLREPQAATETEPAEPPQPEPQPTAFDLLQDQRLEADVAAPEQDAKPEEQKKRRRRRRGKRKSQRAQAGDDDDESEVDEDEKQEAIEVGREEKPTE